MKCAPGLGTRRATCWIEKAPRHCHFPCFHETAGGQFERLPSLAAEIRCLCDHVRQELVEGALGSTPPSALCFKITFHTQTLWLVAQHSSQAHALYPAVITRNHMHVLLSHLQPFFYFSIQKCSSFRYYGKKHSITFITWQY